MAGVACFFVEVTSIPVWVTGHDRRDVALGQALSEAHSRMQRSQGELNTFPCATLATPSARCYCIKLVKGAGNRLVALVNPDWKSPSDFGPFGANAAKEALEEFVLTYSLQSQNVYGYTVSECFAQRLRHAP